VIVIHDGKFQILDGEQRSAYDIKSNPAFAEINNLIVNMVSGNITDERFEMAALENSKQYLVKLVPKDPFLKDVISTMEIYFNKSDLAVEEVVMREGEKDYTVITFIDKQINEAIEDRVFSVDY
jgi:outer membrane lipoprotein-sorting protein